MFKQPGLQTKRPHLSCAEGPYIDLFFPGTAKGHFHSPPSCRWPEPFKHLENKLRSSWWPEAGEGQAISHHLTRSKDCLKAWLQKAYGFRLGQIYKNGQGASIQPTTQNLNKGPVDSTLSDPTGLQLLVKNSNQPILLSNQNADCQAGWGLQPKDG